ncbi:adhesion G protein-coupled receptor E3-like isoform X2 [Lepisosteus oculatus]|uniref:adhesion G protein-coupled receptor E3-like isoform X2 n=1 Tax=Lepisosteus oculatus TaxID=7918 RepID=UPI0035F52077
MWRFWIKVIISRLLLPVCIGPSFPNGTCTVMNVRLVNGYHDCEGRVEVNDGSSWVGVCKDLWDKKDATVVCRELGCGRAQFITGNFGQGKSEKQISKVQCSGNETSVLQCEKIQEFCYGSDAAVVVCSENARKQVKNCRDHLKEIKSTNFTYDFLSIYCSNSSETKNEPQKVIGLLSSFLKKLEIISNLTKEERTTAGEIILQSVENIELTVSANFDEFMKKNKSDDKLALEWLVIPANFTQKIEPLQIYGNTLQVNLQSPIQNTTQGNTAVLFASYTGLESVLDGRFFQSNSSEDTISPQINSHIVTVVIKQKNNHNYKCFQPINVTFQNKQKRSNKNVLFCVYWKSEGNESSWSKTGLKVIHSNETHTVCSSDHLSSFAVIMATNSKQINEDSVLSIISYVFVITALICLSLAIITFVFCKSVHKGHNIIHLHLSLCLFMAHLLFLTGGSKTDHNVICAVIAGVLHFFFLASFVWMCLEGVQLLLLVTNLRVVKYSSRSRLTKRYLLPPGYGIPAIIVAVSAGVFPGGYGTQTRLLTFKSMAQCFIMGCSWILGFFQDAMFFKYAFVIINSLQGPFIFLVHCVLSQQIREEYRRWLRCTRRQKEKSESSGITMRTFEETSTKEHEPK